MGIKIIAFGQVAELAATEIIVQNVFDTNALQQELVKKYPSLQNVKFAVAVDKKIISENTLINEKSIIALLPPFSGG